jgi:succinate dehydrogenase/fumarate reductase flavoprotein subunit
MATAVPGLYAAGEAVGGANGANRLSGNALSEAFVFGERAGRFAAEDVANLESGWSEKAAAAALDEIVASRNVSATESGPGLSGMLVELQELMWQDVGLVRTQGQLDSALARVREMRAEIGERPGESYHRFALLMQDWFDMRNSLMIAETIIIGAQIRTESRGAHQREDFPLTDPSLEHNLVTRLDGDGFAVEPVALVAKSYDLVPLEAAE